MGEGRGGGGRGASLWERSTRRRRRKEVSGDGGVRAPAWGGRGGGAPSGPSCRLPACRAVGRAGRRQGEAPHVLTGASLRGRARPEGSGPGEAPRPLSGVLRPGAPAPGSRCSPGARARGAESRRPPLTAPGRAYCGEGGRDSPGARARARGGRSVALGLLSALGATRRELWPAGVVGTAGAGWRRPAGRGGGAAGWGLCASSPKPWALGGLLPTDPACRVVNWLWVCCRVKGVVAAETALFNMPDGNLRAAAFEGWRKSSGTPRPQRATPEAAGQNDFPPAPRYPLFCTIPSPMPR